MYTKLGLVNGDTLSDSHLQHIEEGILSIEEDVKNFKEKVAKIVTAKGVPATSDDSLNDLTYKINQLSGADTHDYDCGDLIDIRETIQSGQIQMVCTDKGDGRVNFVIWTEDNSQYIVDWGDGTVERYNSGSYANKNYRKGGGRPYKEGETQYVCTVSSTTGNNIYKFRAGGVMNQIVWFASKDIYFTDIDGMFNPNITNGNTRCENLKYVDIIDGALSTSRNTYARCVFGWAYALERVNATINLSGANYAHHFFQECRELTVAPLISGFKGVTEAYNFFAGCNKLTTVSSRLDTSSCTNLNYFFQNCYELTDIQSEFNLESCQNAVYMFQGTKALKRAPELKNTQRLINANHMFAQSGITSFQQSLDLRNAVNINSFFQDCFELIDAPTELIANSAINVGLLFYNCKSLVTAPASLNLPMAENANELFRYCSALRKAPTIINLPRATSVNYMFQNCVTLITAPTEIIAPLTSQAMNLFDGCTSLEQAPYNIELDNATHVYSMFLNCRSLRVAPERINFPNAIYAYNLFNQCIALEKSPLEVNLPKATEVQNMFRQCYRMVNRIDEYSFPQANNAGSLFESCEELRVAPTLVLPKAENVSFMFAYCTQLTTAQSYSFPMARNVGAFYRGCSKLEFAPEFDAPLSTNWGEFYRGCNGLTEITSLSSPYNTTFNYMFYDNTRKVKTLPSVIDFSSVVNQSATDWGQLRYVEGVVTIKGLRSWFELYSCPNLTEVHLLEPTNLIENINVSNNGMSAEAINQLFRELPTPTIRRTINVSGNVGASTCDPSIATAKNWNVTR